MASRTPLRTLVPGLLAAAFVVAATVWSVATAVPPAPTPTPQPSPTDAPAPTETPSATGPTAQPTPPYVALAEKRLSDQALVDARILGELGSGAYSFDAPLVILDPYGLSPLTALVVFRSEAPLRISIEVEGEDALSTVDFTFDEYRTDHLVPVYGLYADAENVVRLTARDEAGKTSETVLRIRTQPLGPTLRDIIVQTDLAVPGRYQPGFNFPYMTNSKKAAYDVNGDYRWYLADDYVHSSSYGFRGRFLFAQAVGNEGDAVFYEMNPLGRIFRVLYSPYGLHHDICDYKDGTIVCTGGAGETIEDFLYQLDTRTGEIVATLDLKRILQRTRAGLVDPEAKDWFHLNAIVRVPGSTDLVISGRSQSAVVRLSWPEGEVRWILSPHEGWSPMFWKYLLAPVGSGFEWSFNQHDPMVLPDQDGNPDTMDLLLFDNGNLRILEAYTQPYTRLVQYRIDERRRTIRQIWSFGKDYRRLLYTEIGGGVSVLDNGNLLGQFSPKQSLILAPTLVELDPDGTIVWQSMSTSTRANGEVTSYRCERLPIYGSEANDLSIGTPALDLIPLEVKASHGIS